MAAACAHDYMVQDVNIQQASRRQEFPCHAQIIHEGRGVTGRVIVHCNHGQAVAAHGVPQRLANPHLSGVHAAAINGDQALHLVLGVEQDHAQLFLLQDRHFRAHDVHHILRPGHDGTCIRLQAGDLPA